MRGFSYLSLQILLFFFADKSVCPWRFDGGWKLYNKTNLVDVDTVIYIASRIPSYTTNIPVSIVEDLLEAHSIHPRFDEKHNVYASRYTPKRIKRIIFAPVGKMPFISDETLRIYDSATRAGILAFLGSFNKYRENILLMIGPEIFDDEVAWRAREMVYLNSILGALYPLYEPHSSKQRYHTFYVYNASADVIRLSESVELGRRVARYISNKVYQPLNAETILSLFKKIFGDTFPGQEICACSLNSESGERTVHLNYVPSAAYKSVYLISTNSTLHGISTIAGFYKILRHFQPSGTEYHAAIVCPENDAKFLSQLHRFSPKMFFDSNPPQENSEVYFIGAGSLTSSRMNARYYGQNFDSEFGPYASEDNLRDIIKESGGSSSLGNANLLELEFGNGFETAFTSPLMALATRFLLLEN